MTRITLAAELCSVCFAHVRGSPVLADVDLAIGRGERLAVVGPNGGGKTTLLRLLLGLLEPDSGRIEVFGRAPAEARRQVGYVPQHTAVDVSMPASALDVVLMGCLRRSPWGLRFARRDRERAQDDFDRVIHVHRQVRPWPLRGQDRAPREARWHARGPFLEAPP